MDNETSEFQYAPLQGDEIRLLRLRYTGLADVVSLDIQHYPQESRPPYIALSYTWGSPEDPKVVFLNDRKVEVRDNLHSFLRHARCDADAPGRLCPVDERIVEIEKKERYKLPESYTLGHFWVDALCIDQNNIPERNLQVRRMKEIYEGAQKVVIWLGPAAEDSEVAMDMVKYLAKTWTVESLDPSCPIDPEFFGPPDGPFTDENWTALGKLFHRQWIERAWIIQEATASGPDEYPAAVWCGNKRQTLVDFVVTTHKVSQAITQIDFAKFALIRKNSFPFLFTLKMRRQNLEDYAPMDLCSLMAFSRGFKATDPRDLIYALLSIAVDGQHDDLRPDYDLPVEDVYRRFASHLITQHDNLDILGFCCGRTHISIPTWVPDWTLHGFPLHFPKRRGNSEYIPVAPLYDACGGRPANIEFLCGGQSLVVKGLMLDTVVEVSGYRRATYMSDFERDIPLAISWTDFALGKQHDAPYCCGGTRLEALQRVICGDFDSLYDSDVTRGYAALWPAQALLNKTNTPSLPNPFTSDTIINEITHRRRLIKTERGYLGLVPMYAEPGDFVCVLFGGQLPFVLRGGPDSWELVGECYVHGFMDGEAFQNPDAEIRRFEII